MIAHMDLQLEFHQTQAGPGKKNVPFIGPPPFSGPKFNLREDEPHSCH